MWSSSRGSVFFVVSLALAACGNPAAESCGNGVCVAGAGEACSTCPADCGSCAACGDGSCRGGETCASCASDCGACAGCGDGSCSVATETCSSCAADCGMCTMSCSPATCAGCCDGDSCVTGTSPGACGAGGGSCMVCSPSFLCTIGVCTVDPASRWNVVLETLTVATTRYDGAAWDTIGGSPDPYVEIVATSATTPSIGTSGSGTDTYSVAFTPPGPTASDVRASDMLAFLGFAVFDDDSPPSPTDDGIGFCGGPEGSASFTGVTQTVDCGADAGTMNSGYTLTYHLERF